ncbi:MAG: DUF4326 domain-containing protein [Candidatus Eremiobacteraeota bacterium]|nr:DUF4326 domain-containing protein [Candidatus Eremiobacteraeota bacterium]
MPSRRIDNVASGSCERCPHGRSVHLGDGTCVACERIGAASPCFVERGHIGIANLREGRIIEGEYVGRAVARRRLRGSPLANPFRIAHDSERDAAVAKYADWLREHIATGDEAVTTELDRLTARFRAEQRLMLLCWCAPQRCHAEVIAEEVRRRAQEEPQPSGGSA